MADINFSDFMAETKRDTKTIEMPDGTIIEMPPVELMSDEFFAAAKGEDHAGMARAMIGDEAYKVWTSFGGNALSLLKIFGNLYGIKLPNSLGS